jgi:hypothetical protein
MEKKQTVLLDIKKLRARIDEKKTNPEFNPNIFTQTSVKHDPSTGKAETSSDNVITKFELSSDANKEDKEQFIKDWGRNNGIFISHNGKEHYIDPRAIDEKELKANPIKALKDSIESEGVEITEKQVNRIVQHFSQRSIQAMDVLFANSGEVKESNPRLLNLEMDNEGSMKMSFCSSVGSTSLDSNDKSTTKLVSTHKFEAKINKEGAFEECSLAFQYQNPALSSIPQLTANESFADCFKKVETDKDFTIDNIDNVVKLLAVSTKDADAYKDIIAGGLDLSKFTGSQERKSLPEYILGETLLNPKFVLDQKPEKCKMDNEDFLSSLGVDREKVILEEVLKLHNGKEVVKEALTASVVQYLDREFKTRTDDFNTSVSLTKDQKSQIASGVEKIIEPLREVGNRVQGQNSRDIENGFQGRDELANLLNGLDSKKLVSLAAQESNDVKTGFYGTIKKFCRHIVDALPFSRTSHKISKDIVDSFKRYVSDNPTPRYPFVQKNRNGKSHTP